MATEAARPSNSTPNRKNDMNRSHEIERPPPEPPKKEKPSVAAESLSKTPPKQNPVHQEASDTCTDGQEPGPEQDNSAGAKRSEQGPPHTQPAFRRAGFVPATEIRAKPIRWLAEGYLARGQVHLLQGDPEVGKSTVVADMMANLSRGRAVLPGLRPKPPVACVFITAEESADVQIKPKLLAADADMGMLYILDQSSPRTFSIADLETVQQAMLELAVALLVIDGFFSFFGKGDIYNDRDIRERMKPLCSLAAATGAAVVLIRHDPKSRGQRGVAGGLGGMGFTAMARVVIKAGMVPGELGEVRALALAKSSLRQKPPARTYTISGVAVRDGGPEFEAPRITWGDTRPDLTADDLYAEITTTPPVERTAAAQFILDNLTEPVGWKTLVEAAQDEGLSAATLRRARDELKAAGAIDKTKDGSGPWLWSRLATAESSGVGTGAEVGQ